MAETNDTSPVKRLTRSSRDRVLVGVCGGLAEFFVVDSTIVRVIFVLMTFFGGFGILLYLVLALVIPGEEKNSEPTETVRQNAQEFSQSVKEGAEKIKSSLDAKSISERRSMFGLLLLILGLLLLLGNFGLFEIFRLDRFWPVLLILAGLVVLARGQR